MVMGLLLLAVGTVAAVLLCGIKAQSKKAHLDPPNHLYDDVVIKPSASHSGYKNVSKPQCYEVVAMQSSELPAYEEVELPTRAKADLMELKVNVAYGKAR